MVVLGGGRFLMSEVPLQNRYTSPNRQEAELETRHGGRDLSCPLALRLFRSWHAGFLVQIRQLWSGNGHGVRVIVLVYVAYLVIYDSG